MTDAERWKMVVDVLPLVDWWLLRRTAIRGPAMDDCRQVIVMRLFDYTLRWLPEKSKWSTFAVWGIRSGIRAYIFGTYEYGPRNQYDPQAERAGLTPRVADTELPTEDDMQEAFDEQRLIERLKQVVRAMPPRERACLLRHLDSETLEETGKRLGISRERVRQLGERAKDIIRRKVGNAA